MPVLFAVAFFAAFYKATVALFWHARIVILSCFAAFAIIRVDSRSAQLRALCALCGDDELPV